MPGPSVSVIIPTYNRAHCIRDAVESVLAQSFGDFELIVVDDGSTDATPDILSGYGSRLKLVGQANGGASSARNLGLTYARGEWVAFLDSDDVWNPDKLRVHWADVQAHPEVVAHIVDGIIRTPQKEISSFDLRGLKAEFAGRPFRERPLLDVLRAVFWPSCWLIRRAVFDASGRFDPGQRMHEDRDLLTRIALEGPFLVNCHPGAYILRKEGAALSHLHESARLESLQNLVGIYARLKGDARLNAHEYRYVCRGLSGVRSEVAVQRWKQGEVLASLGAHVQSIADDRGLRSCARLLMAATGTLGLFRKLFREQNSDVAFRCEDEYVPGQAKKTWME